MRKQILVFVLSALALATLVLGISFAFGSEIISEIGLLDAALALLFPIVLGLLISVVSTWQTKNSIESLEGSLSDAIRTQKLVVHGNKYKFPDIDKATFWNNFLLQAEYRFILVGNTNKSWVKGGKSQSELLGSSIIRIIKNGGSIQILSCSEEKIVESNLRFIENHVVDKASNLSQEMQLRAEDSIEYVTVDGINYNAVVSDDRLVILPRTNDEDFQQNAIVLEISPIYNNDMYTSYRSDIESTFRTANSVELPW